VKAGYIEHKQTRRNGRALSGANSDGAENLRCTLEYESALAFGEERLDSGNQVSGDTFSGEAHSQLVCADLSNPPLTSRKRVDTSKEAA